MSKSKKSEAWLAVGGGTNKCRFERCDEPHANSECPYCEEHLDQLEQRIWEDLKVIADLSSRIYVGRSYFPERRIIEHRTDPEKQLDYISPLYWTASRDEASHLERKLIELTRRNLRKGANEAPGEKDGWWSGSWYAVYVAWSPKRGTKKQVLADPRLDIHSITTLDPGHRSAPQLRTLDPDRIFTLGSPSALECEVLLDQWYSVTGFKRPRKRRQKRATPRSTRSRR